MSELPERNGWSIARHAGDKTPDKTQRLLNHASWDTFAAMGVVRRFAVAGLEEAARRGKRRGGLVIAAIDETGQEKAGEATAGVKRQYLGCAGRVANGINTVHQGFVKVANGVQPGESPVRSRNWRALRGSWAMRRVSAVYLVTPCRRKRVMTRLVRADQIWGAFPVRMSDLSSFQITSRSQCACSTRQWPRTWARRSSGVVSSAARLVR